MKLRVDYFFTFVYRVRGKTNVALKQMYDVHKKRAGVKKK